MNLLLYYKARPMAWRALTKTLLVMKLITILLFVVCLQVQARSLGQTVTLSVKEVPLTQVLTEIEKQSGYQFFYKDNFIDPTAKVSVQLKNAPLNDALLAVLKDKSLSFEIVRNTIVIREKKQATQTLLAAYLPPQVVEGIVKSATGKPLMGVVVKAPRVAVLTDKDGHFSIRAAEKEVLVFSYIGYKTREVIVGSNTVLSITLEEAPQELSDMVVVGYGTVKRKDLTGSVASVNTEEIKNVPFTSLDQALTGKAAGVQVIQADGSPGGVAKIRIRGGTSLMGGNDPLYIIDGVQMYIENRYVENSAEMVNPIERFGSDNSSSTVSGSFARGLNSLAGLNISDIESIDILKDASATAIYGSRAANGVVIITTKKGKTNQKPVLEANYYTGLSRAIKQPLLNATEYLAVMKEAAQNLNNELSAHGLPANTRATQILTNPDFLGTANTDWMSLVMRNGINHNADISIRGGGSGSRYYTSLAYTKQNGTVVGTDFSRVAGKMSLNNEITSKLNVNANLDYGFTKNNITNGMYAQAMYAPPTIAPYKADGTVNTFLASTLGGADYQGYQNPLALLDGVNEAKNTTLIGSLTAEYSLLKELVFRSVVSVNYNNYHQLNYVPSTAVIAVSSGVGSSNFGTGSQTQTETVNTFYENTVTWDKQFNHNHRLNVLAGTSWQKFRTNSFSASGQTYPDDKFLTNLSSAAVPLSVGGTSSQNSLLSFYVRANYALKERYLFTFTGRSDASSKFPSNNRVGYFPSGGVAWRISQESFMANVHWLNELKLRASAGLTGTQNIADYLFYTLYSPLSYGGTNALVPTQLGNDQIKWEQTRQLDLGLDFELFGSRLRGGVGYYDKHTKGNLLTVPVATSTSFSNVVTNYATISNKGLEIDLRGDFIKRKNFQWTGAINISANRSKVMDINSDFSNPNGSTSLTNMIVRNGEPLGLFYGAQFTGLIQNQKQLDDYKKAYTYYNYFQPYLNIGDPMYKLNATGTGFAKDVIGNAQPTFYGGYTNTFTYKGLSLITLFTFSQGGDILYLADVQNMMVNNGTNKGTAILNHYSATNTGSNRPRLIQGYNATAYNASNNVYDGSFIKMKTITLSYQLPAAVASRLHLRMASLYATATNVFTITHYPGPDPEVSNNPYSLISGSTDAGTYPTVRQYTVGVRLGL